MQLFLLTFSYCHHTHTVPKIILFSTLKTEPATVEADAADLFLTLVQYSICICQQSGTYSIPLHPLQLYQARFLSGNYFLHRAGKAPHIITTVKR